MLEGFEIIKRPGRTTRFIFRTKNNELKITENDIINMQSAEAEKQISLQAINKAVKEQLDADKDLINEKLEGKQRDKKLLELETSDYQKKLKTLIKNRLVSKKQKEIGAVKFLAYINNIMDKLNEIYEAINGST